MSASDYGLNYGLKPGDKLPSVAALRRQQRAQEQASAIANKTLNALLSHPNQAATRSLLSVSSALHPDNPGYANSLQQLSDVAAATPGTMPDAAAAMVYNGIDPDTKLGAQLSTVQASADLQAGAEKLKTEWIARQAAELQAAADTAAENSGPMGYVKSFAQVTMNAMSFAQQVEMNVFRQTVNTKDGTADPILSYFTSGLNSDTYANTDLGQNVAGGLHYVDTGKLNMDQLDMGDGFLPEPESPVLKLKKAWDQQMMGTAGRNMRTIDMEQPDGTIKKVTVDDSPASPGQWVASDVFDLDAGTRPYQMMSGLLDAGSYLLDPTMYLTAGGVTKGFALAENKLLRAAHPTMDSKLSAIEQGAWKGGADEALGGVATTEAQKATAAAKLAENEQLLAFEREAHDAAQRAVDEATSPQVRAEADAAAKGGAVRTLTPATREAAEAGAQESFARQAHLILGEQEPKLSKAAAEAEDAARLEQKRLYTPVDDTPATPGHARPPEVAEGVPYSSWTRNPAAPPEPPGSVPNQFNSFGAGVVQDGDKWKAVSSLNSKGHTFDTLEEANAEAARMARTLYESEFMQSPAGLKVNLDEWNALDAAGRDAVIEAQRAAAPRAERPLVDTRGSGDQFHGSAKEFELGPSLDDGGTYYNNSNIIGQGLYTTDGLDVAAGYIKKNRRTQGAAKGDGVVYKIVEKEPVQFFDLTKPLKDNPEVKAWLDEWKATDQDGFISDSIDEAVARHGDDVSLGHIYEMFRENSASYGWSRDSINELFDSAQYTLQHMGFGGYIDEGGKYAGRGKVQPHTVKVYWDPINQVTREVVDLSTMRQAAAPGSVTAVEAGGKYHLTHSSGAVVAVVDDAAEAERLAGELSKMPGYAKNRTLEQVESWDYVKQRGESLGPIADDVAAEFKAANEAADAAKKEPDTVPGGSAGDGHSVDDLLAKRDGHRSTLEQLQKIRQELETEAANAEKNHARAEVHAKAQAARIHEQMRHSKFSGDPVDNNDAMQFLREVSGLKAGSNALDVDKALGFITNNYNGAWNKLMDSMVAIKDPALLDEVTRGKLGAEAVADIAAAGSKDELRAVLAKHLARPDALSANMGRLRGVKIAAQVRYGKDLDAVVSQYARFFGHPALGAVIYGKQLKRASVPWSHARHIEDHDGVVDTVYDQITYALDMNRAVSHHGGQGIHGKGGVGKRATPGNEALLDDAGQPVLDTAGAPKMKDIWEDVPYESALDFRRKWMAKFIKAKPGQELRGLWNQLHTELVDRAADIHGLPSDLRAQFKEALRLSRMDVKNYTKYNTETRATEQRAQILFDGEVIADDLVSKEAQMSDYLIAPDWQEMRRAMSSAKEVLDKGGLTGNSRKMLNEITGTVFERYWRTSVIAFRGAYLIRNMADIQFRMLLNGSPNMATNPQAILGLAFSNLAKPEGRIGRVFDPLNKAIGKAFNKAKVGDSNLLGKDLYEQAEPELQAYLRKYMGEEHVFGGTPFQDMASKGNRTRSHADPTQGAAPKYETIAYEEVQAPVAGTRAAAADSFWEGWDFSLGLLRNSPMAAMALDVTHGEVPAFLKSRAGEGLMHPKEALVDYLRTDPSGRKILDRALDGSPGIRRLVGDPDVDNGRRLGLYLFGEDEMSLASQWDRLTLNGDEVLVNAARAPRMEDEAGRLQQRRDMQKLIKARAKEQGYIVDGVVTDKRLPVGAVPRDITVENKQGFWAHYDKLVDFFFSSSGKFEHAAGYLPEFRFNKWSRAASMAAVLSPDDAAKLVANATKALGGHHMPNSWAGKTLRELKRNAGKAKGSGAFSLDDLEHATDVMAAKHVKELFYDARNRNQFANSLRLISPFAQPWANTLMQWTKLGLAKPGKVYAAGVLFSAAEGRNSNWLQDDPMSPNDAFFYRDPKSRQLTVGVPMLGPAMALIGNLNPVTKLHNLGSDAPISIDPSMVGGGIQLQSMNIALQDGLLPGSGPLGTLAAGVLEQFGWYRSSMPDVFKDFLMPFVNADPDSDPTMASTLIPAWAQGILGSLGFRDWAPKIEKYMPGAMAALAQQNPDNRYYSLNAQGDIQQSDAQRAAFITDAEHYAGSMLFGRAWVQNVAPGAPQVQQLMVADDGRIMATAKLSQEYMSELRTTGDRPQALAKMLETYGAEAVFALLPTRGSTVTPTNAAYTFLKENPGMAEDYIGIVPIMAPEGGYSARMDRYMRQRGGDPSLSTDETAKYVNAFMKDAAQGQIDRRYNAGEITKEQYDAESQGLTDSYQEAGADMPDWNNFGEDAASYRAALVGSPDGTYKGALADPAFVKAFPKVAPALIQYEKYRTYAIQHSGKDTFGSNEMSEWNAWLWKKQGELIQQYPSSRVAFTKVYMPELEAK